MTKVEILELGGELVASLQNSAPHDLLAHWMARHLAELLARERKASGADKKRLSDECADLILKLWEHRNALPDGARPLQAFEPIFQVLQNLASGQSRHAYMRVSLPPVKVPTEIQPLISLAAKIDQAADTMIRYVIARAVERIPADDKRWAKLRAALTPGQWDMSIVFELIGQSEKMLDRKEKLKAAEIKEMRELLKAVDALSEIAPEVSSHFKKRLKEIESL
jgi:hypothetical protein